MDLRRIARNASWAQCLCEVNRRRGGTASRPPWTDAEEQNGSRPLPHYGAMQKALKLRSYSAIRHEARLLGVAKRWKPWTASEILRLRRFYPHASRQALLQAFLHADWARIKSKAKELGLYRPAFKFKPTPWPLLNAIRARAHELVLHTG